MVHDSSALPLRGSATPPLGRTLMVQGTASSVGKSLLVAGLCRYFRNQGYRVAPFKSQNMALNSFATADGLEIGRAQAVQAWAAGKQPAVDMNPILLKPTADTQAQVVVMGKPQGSLSAMAYHQRKREYAAIIEGCLGRLRADNDLVIIEGAGSPAEINLRERDIANMFVAELADAPVLLAGDIDRGGVFAAFVGTLMLLTPEERARVRGLIINKFRGDLALFADGRQMLQERAQCPVLGVVPYLRDLGIADEDSTTLLSPRGPAVAADAAVRIAVVMFPYLSNYDDFLPLEREPGVHLSYVGEPDELADADLVVLPGTKSTRGDLNWLRTNGLAAAIEARVRAGRPVLGICGGYQMLGERIEDPEGAEGAPGACDGLGLLPCVTRFSPDKITRQVSGALAPSFLTNHEPFADPVSGYEIHMGRVALRDGATALLDLGGELEGCASEDGRCVGTLMHGLFDHDGLRAGLLAGLRRARGLQEPYEVRPYRPDDEFDRLASALSESLDTDQLHRIVGLPRA